MSLKSPPFENAILTSSASNARDLAPIPLTRAAPLPAASLTKLLRMALRRKGLGSCMLAMCARMGLNCQLTSSCICERRRMSPCGSSMRPERMMGHIPASASTSSMARCVTVSRPKALAMSESLWEESMGSAIRERARLSTQSSLTSRPPGTFSTKPRSKLALWAMTGMPPTKFAKSETASWGHGASATSMSRICVSARISGGMGRLGLTKVLKRSATSFPTRRAAAISMSSQSLNESPVVSVSRTMTPSSRGPKSVCAALSGSPIYASRTAAVTPGTSRAAMVSLTVLAWLSCIRESTLACGAHGNILEGPLDKEGTELRKLDTSMTSGVGQKTPVRHAGDGVSLEHYWRSIILDDEVRA